jgi:dihydroneopterin aldolase
LFPSFAAAFAGAPPSALGRAAEAVAEAILDAHQRVSAASVTIHMPHASIPAMFDGVGTTIVRSRSLR